MVESSRKIKVLGKGFIVADFLKRHKNFVSGLAALSALALCSVRAVESLDETLVDEAQLSIFEESTV